MVVEHQTRARQSVPDLTATRSTAGKILPTIHDATRGKSLFIAVSKRPGGGGIPYKKDEDYCQAVISDNCFFIQSFKRKSQIHFAKKSQTGAPQD